LRDYLISDGQMRVLQHNQFPFIGTNKKRFALSFPDKYKISCRYSAVYQDSSSEKSKFILPIQEIYRFKIPFSMKDS